MKATFSLRIWTLVELCLLVPSWLMAQNLTVSGRITDAAGRVMPGVSVVQKGTNVGTSSNADGVYRISNLPSTATLVFSYVGYLKQETVLNGRSTVDIQLAEDASQLNEVVVTAVGIQQQKRELTYSLQTVAARELVQSREVNVVTALAAKVAGVQVTTFSGAPGSGAQIRIRGNNSLSGSNAPLFIVDGVPIDNSQIASASTADPGASVTQSNRAIDLNADDIANLSILKGPAATALYGIRAANGAVVITTKRGGEEGKDHLTVSWSSSLLFDRVNRYPAIQNVFAQGGLDARGNTVYRAPSTGQFEIWGPRIDTLRYAPSVPSLYDPRGSIVGQSDSRADRNALVQPFDNVGNFFQTGRTWNNHLSVSGGTEKGHFYLSAGRLYQTGVVPKTDFERNTFKLAGGLSINPKLKFTGSATYVNSGGNRIQTGTNFFSVFQSLYRANSPTFDIANGSANPTNDPLSYSFPDGTQRNSTGAASGGYNNPYWLLNKNSFRDNVNRVFGFGQVDWSPNDWLTVTGRAGTDLVSEVRKEYLHPQTVGTSGGVITDLSYAQRDISTDLFAQINRTLLPGLNLNVIVGHNFFNTWRNTQSTQGTGLTLGDFLNQGVATTFTNSQSLARRKLAAGYGVVQLNFKEMLFLNLTGRNEWTSTLPAGKNSFFYGAVSGGFIFTELPALKDQNLLNFGKIRLAVAEVGNDAPIYSFDNTYGVPLLRGSLITSGGISFPFRGVTGFTLGNQLANPDLRPERISTVEVGTELQFLRNLFRVDLTYYHNRSRDQIVSVPISSVTGFGSTIINAGEIENKGFEAVVDATPLEKGRFRWDVAVNFTRNRNKVITLAPGVNEISYLQIGTQGGNRSLPGQPFGMLFGGRWLRDEQGRILIDDVKTINNATNPNYGYPLRDPNAGPIGNPNPNWLLGFRNTFSYAGLTLSALLDVRQGGQVFNGTKGIMVAAGTATETLDRGQPKVFEGVKNADKSTNDIVVTPGRAWYTGNGGSALAEQWVEDASWVRLRELTLSYKLPTNWLKGLRIRSAELGFSGRNLWLQTPYKGTDPETNYVTGSEGSLRANVQGIDYFNTPNTKSWGFSLRAQF